METGYTFNYRLAEQTSKDGTACVIVDEELWLKGCRGSEQILSSYPYGNGRREDAVVDGIREAFAELAQDASETGVVVRETFGPWQQARWILKGCTLENGIVKALRASLSSMNRVTVAVPDVNVKNNK